MSDTKKQNFDIVICGAGPGGAALASICADRGISTALIERQSEFSQEFRGEGIMPSGYEALKSIGFDLDKIYLPIQKNLKANAAKGSLLSTIGFVVMKAEDQRIINING